MRPDWVEEFMALTEPLTSPAIFRKWAAISTLAGALERKVWVMTTSPVYPNMYVVLVAPPGIGKTEVTWRVRSLWEDLPDHNVASSSVTKASLIDELAAAERRWVKHQPKPGEQPVDSFNALLLSINELGVLIPAYENEFMNTLTDLWDGKGYSERRRTSKIEHNIKKPFINLLAACTPSYLMNVLPEGAWDQGFLARTMLIYSGEMRRQSLFNRGQKSAEEWKRAQKLLESCAALYGELRWTEESARAIDAFHLDESDENKPDHPKLISYTIRRSLHLIKLCIIASVSRSDELLITKEDFDRALTWLLEAEAYMPDIFKAMTQGGAGKVMDEVWYYVFTTYAKEQKPILHSRLIQFLQERVPIHNIEPTIKMMVDGEMLKLQSLTAAGKAYVPRARKAPR